MKLITINEYFLLFLGCSQIKNIMQIAKAAHKSIPTNCIIPGVTFALNHPKPKLTATAEVKLRPTL